MRRSPPKRTAFTFIEILTVVMIVGVLVALLLPAVSACREASRRSQCSHQLSQLILAVHQYESAHGVYPPGSVNNTRPILNRPKGYHHSWLVQVLPFIDQPSVAASIDSRVGAYHANNARPRSIVLPILICPSETARGPNSSYAGVHNDAEAPIDVTNNGVLFLNSRIRYEDILDGSSHTAVLGEKLVDPGDLGWMSGTRATLRNAGLPFVGGFMGAGSGGQANSGEVNSDGSSGDGSSGDGFVEVDVNSTKFVGGFGSHHAGGALFAFADGRVQYLGGLSATQANRADGQLYQ